MDILKYVDDIISKYSPEPTQGFNKGGSVTTPKRGLVDEAGSYAGKKQPISDEEFKKLYSEFTGTDLEFAEELNKNYKPKLSDSYSSKIVQHTRNKLNIESNIKTDIAKTAGEKRREVKVLKLEKLIAEANAGDKFVSVKEIFDQVPEIAHGSRNKYQDVMSTLDSIEDKVDNVLKDLLISNEPLPDSLIKIVTNRVGGVTQRHMRKYIKQSPTFKTIAPAGGEALLKITNLSNFQDLSLTESLQRAMDIELGQPTYTNLKGVKGRFYSPAYVTMKFAKQNWNLNKGEGPIKFFDSKGREIKWKYGLELPINDVSFSYKGKTHKYKDILNTDYAKKFFPEVYETTIAANKFKASKIPNPFKPGSDITVQKLVREIAKRGYEVDPRWGTIDILHGQKGVKGEPFTNLRYNTKDINQMELGLSSSLKSGNITQKEYDNAIKNLNNLFVGTSGEKFEQSVINRLQKQAEKINKGSFYKYDEFKKIMMGYCPNRKARSVGGRIGYGEAGVVEGATCSMEEAAEGLRTALKDVKGNPAKLKKFEKVARLGGAFFGWVDAPLELAFALPGMLQGNRDKALRDTTLGLFGAGRTEFEKLDPNSKAYKVAKESQDIQKWTENYFNIQEADNYLKNTEFGENVNSEQRDAVLKKRDALLQDQENIIDAFSPTDLTEKVQARKEVRDTLKKQAELGLTITDVPFVGDVKFNPYAKGEDISKTIDYLKYEGDPYYKLTKPFEEETGISMFGDFSDKELADRYSDLPIGIAAGLSRAEKQQLLSGLKRERTAGQYAPRKLLEEQGFDLSEINKAKMFASGGIARLTRTTAPESGPNSGGLASLTKYGKQY